MSKNLKRSKVVWGGLFLILFPVLWCQAVVEPVLIDNPKPTHYEKNFVPIELIKEIPLDFSEDNFFARPTELKVDRKGNIFVYDDILNKILIFDPNFNFVRSFGQVGVGPGDWSRFDTGIKHILIGKDGNLYVSDPNLKKILIFNNKGQFLKDFRLQINSILDFFPVMDERGTYYINSISGGAVDILDKNFKNKTTLLSHDDYMKFIIHLPISTSKFKTKYTSKGKNYMSITSDSMNTFYDLLPNNGLFIYLANSSSFYIFKNGKIIKSFNILPAETLEYYRERIERLKKKLKSKSFYSAMIQYMFLDKDSENFFYFVGHAPSTKIKKTYIYQMDFNGQLKTVYETNNGANFYDRWKDYFYGIGTDCVRIYKIKNSKVSN